MGALINLGSYYLIGIPSALLFAFVFDIGGKGLWQGIICALIVQVSCLLIITIPTDWEQEAKKAKDSIRVHDNAKPRWIQWLDVSFGSQPEVSREQLEEIAFGLEESSKERERVSKPMRLELSVGKRLRRGSNLGVALVVEEIRFGVRVETSDGSVRGFVRREGLKKTVTELMEGEKGKEATKKVSDEWACMAKKAVDKGGSSWSNLESLLQEMCVMEGDAKI
ncbi:hypothetical protein PIB30_037783 [Stylosanthes scabra]|uniref:Uncharacterized protein n=1 Tax=Stylosanthes scabra TaxID=79078 RepID=A0ABU6XCA1_9FABA|nr:hypothetical protein [Stylosanthes scabra]